MQESLKQETEKLARCWRQHEAAWLRDYLVADVEDPRLNLQSILSRHFLLRGISGDRFQALMAQEYRFAAAMNWLRALARRIGDTEELAVVLHALKQGADNAEGIEIPQFVLRIFATLPAIIGDLTVPNYLESFLTGTLVENGQAQLHEPSLETFQQLWHHVLATESPTPLSVLEPACGSANDFRFLQAYGIARLVDYTGFDLCEKNIENARALFPNIKFEVGNAFAIPAPGKAYDLCFVHDLLEHLSLEGMQTAVQELCRVTRQGLCVGFFNMDEIPAHQLQPVEEYHWNKLSMARMKELFAAQGFKAQVLHIGSFLRQHTGCEQTHNPNAYTFLLSR